MFLSAGQANNLDSASFAIVHFLCCSVHFESQKCKRYSTFHKVFCEHCWDYDNLKCRKLKMIVINIQQRWRLHRGDGSQFSHDSWSQLITQHRTLSSEERFLTAGQANNPDSASFATVCCLCCFMDLKSLWNQHYNSPCKVFCEHCWDYDNQKCREIQLMVIRIQQCWHSLKRNISLVTHDLWNQLITQDLMSTIWTVDIRNYMDSHSILPDLPKNWESEQLWLSRVKIPHHAQEPFFFETRQFKVK